MHTKTLFAGTALAALSMIPSCPAPMVPAIIDGIIAGIAAPLAGGIIAVGLEASGQFKVPQCCAKTPHFVGRLERVKVATRQLAARQEDWPPGVSDESIEQCRVTNVNRQVTLTRTGEYCMFFLPQNLMWMLIIEICSYAH
jgi:hypothetical protein